MRPEFRKAAAWVCSGAQPSVYPLPICNTGSCDSCCTRSPGHWCCPEFESESEHSHPDLEAEIVRFIYTAALGQILCLCARRKPRWPQTHECSPLHASVLACLFVCVLGFPRHGDQKAQNRLQSVSTSLLVASLSHARTRCRRN